jgi:hypothetical protein
MADYHMLTVGITEAIPTGLPPVRTIDEIHRQVRTFSRANERRRAR